MENIYHFRRYLQQPFKNFVRVTYWKQKVTGCCTTTEPFLFSVASPFHEQDVYNE